MSDFSEKLVVAGIGSAITLIAVFIGYKMKRRGDRLEALRKAYSQWFTAETIFTRRVKKLAADSQDALNGKTQHDVLMKDIDALEELIKPIIAAVNDALLLEKKEKRRRRIIILQEFVGGIFRVLRSLADHHKEHIDMRALRKNLRGQLRNENPQEAKIAIQATIDRITEWDQQCDSVDPQAIKDIVWAADEIHNLSESLREAVASKLR